MKAAAAAEEEEGRAEKAVTLQPAQNPDLRRAVCSAAAAAALSVWPACPVGVCSRTDERTNSASLSPGGWRCPSPRQLIPSCRRQTGW